MKTNLPITDHELHFQPQRPLVSKTDLKGVINYVNPAFVEISGYTKAELLGSSHNIVRHPDMPPEAFSDMWQTLKADRPWRGLVKNRCKSGDFYWVDAYVTPLYDNGVKVGYQSIRSVPNRHEIQQAEALYRSVNQKHTIFPESRTHTLTSIAVRMVLLAFIPLIIGSAITALGQPVWLGLLASTLVSCGLLLWVWSGIKKPFQEIKNAISHLADANFKFEVDTLCATEFSSLLVNIKSMQVSLRSIIADVISGADYIEERSGCVREELGSIVNRSQSQSHGIASVAAALEQLTVSVKEISEATTRSSYHAGETMKLVGQGVIAMEHTKQVTNDLVSRVHEAQIVINDLDKDVLAINNITQTIKEIAEQTNLLALNAAIEAARAGETGRGFAVVADEVRKLAERTSQSTIEIGGTIRNVVAQTETALSAMQLATSKVEESTALLNDSHAAFTAIKTSSEEVTISSGEIANMLKQQSAASSEVAINMENMSTLTEKNDQGVQEVEKSVLQLSEAAVELHVLVKKFEQSL
jgi:aerotaxis receptor